MTTPSRERHSAGLFWIPVPAAGSLAITPRPRGGDWLEVDIERLARAGIDIVVSLLTPDETEELGLESEAACCRARGIEFVSAATPDLGAPSDVAAFDATIASLASAIRDGRSIAIHCRQSVGRSGLTVCAILLSHGLTLDDAIAVASQARGVAVPETTVQREWLRDYAIRVDGTTGVGGGGR